MNRNVKVAGVGLSIALLVSIGINVFLFRQGQEYFRQLNAQRLDPLGLAVYAGAAEKGPLPAIVFFGDSRAAQWPAPEGIQGMTVVNRGIGNQTTAQVVERFSRHIAPLRPKIIVLQVGVNDLKTIPLFPERKEAIVSNCKARFAELVRMSRETGAHVIITTIFPLGTIPLERRLFWSEDVAAAIEDVNAYVRTLASDRVSIFETRPILAGNDGVARPDYCQDFLHLNPDGYRALNRAMVKLLAP